MADAGDRGRFLTIIMAACGLGARCVVTVRADFYDRPLQHALIGEALSRGTFPLPSMDPKSIEEVIVQPATQNGVYFEDGVVSTLVAEANNHSASLPLLEFTMAELYERRVDDQVTVQAFDEIGGLGGAISRRAEEIFAGLDSVHQERVRQLFGRLVVPGLGAPDTRRRAPYGELSENDRVVADQFVEARLLVADRDGTTREPVYEVAHEALLTNWPRLQGWLEADRAWLLQLQHLATATSAWHESGQSDSELYRGGRLESVLEAMPEHSTQLNESETAFVEASRNAWDSVRNRERRSARRLRRMLTGIGCLLVAALIAGVIAFHQRQQARSSQRDTLIESLVSRSLNLRSTHRDAAALLAFEANDLADTPRTRSALLAMFTGSLGFTGTQALPGSLGATPTGVVAADGKTAFVAGFDGLVPRGTTCKPATSARRGRSRSFGPCPVPAPWSSATMAPFSPRRCRCRCAETTLP